MPMFSGGHYGYGVSDSGGGGGGTSAALRYSASTTQAIDPNTLIIGSSNLTNNLGNYSARNFFTQVMIYINGVLQVPGIDYFTTQDVYPSSDGGNQLVGGFYSKLKIKNGANITMVIL